MTGEQLRQEHQPIDPAAFWTSNIWRFDCGAEIMRNRGCYQVAGREMDSADQARDTALWFNLMVD
jgi:hypothetical protein